MMTEAIDPRPRGEALSGLPKVLDVKAKRVRYDPPRRYYSEGKLVSEDEAVELLVRTAAPLPVRDLTPVLFIGDTVVDEYERTGPNLYRFRVYRFGNLLANARISIGWDYAPEARIATDFHFKLSNVLPTS